MEASQGQANPVEEAKAALIAAQTEKTKAETVNKNVEGMYSGTQAAREIAMTPQLAPMIDQMLKSAGFEDKDAPPVVAGPAMPVPGQELLAADQQAPQNTNPLTPANPGVGMQAGIESPGVVPGE